MLAACTQAGLKSHLKQLPDDGLIHRFIPVIMRPPTKEFGSSMKGAADRWADRIRNVYERTQSKETRAPIHFSPAAQEIFDAEDLALRDLVEALSDLSPSLAAHVGKPGMIARVALTFHLIDAGGAGAIPAPTVQMAIRFMRRVREHAYVMFTSILSTSPSVELARAVASSIAADPSVTPVNRNWLTQHCRLYRNSDDQQRRHAVQILEDCGWLVPDLSARAYGGWPVSTWQVNPLVATKFAEQGAAHRLRREMVREVFSDE